MKNKDRYFYLEYFLTFLLLLLVIFLLGEIVSAYRLYLILGLICGFGFSWFNREKSGHLIRFFITIGALGSFVWIIYSLLNSSFFYKEVIIIWIKGTLVLGIILSFNACSTTFLTYIQTLSVPLFMGSPLFIKGYNEISVISILGYFICWFAILRVKFYEFFKSGEGISFKRYYSSSTLIIFFLISIFISWILFSSMPLGKIRKGGLFPEEGGGEEVGLEETEKEYYDLQDKLQKKTIRLISELKSPEDKNNILFSLSSLIQESSYIIEVDKAERGMISFLNTAGPGLEKRDGEELTLLIKTYLDKKISLNLKRTKDSIIDKLKKNAFNIKKRISILNQVNNIQYSNSYQQIRKYESELQAIIDNSLLNIDVKRQLKGLARQFREWKVFEIYRKKSDFLEKKIDSFRQVATKEEVSRLLSDIDRIDNIADFKEVENAIKRLKETGSYGAKESIKEIEEVLDLKLEMLLSEKSRKLKEKLEYSNLPEDKIRELKESVDTIKDMKEYQAFSESLSRLQEGIEEDSIDISAEIKELTETKIYLFTKQKKEKIDQILKESILPDSGRDLLEDLKKLELDKKDEKLISDSKKLEDSVEKFFNQGFITKRAKDDLIREIEDIKDLLLLRLKASEEIKVREILAVKQTNYQKEWEELIEGSSLKEEKKEVFKQLIEELSKAQTVSQVERIREAIEKEIDALFREGANKEEVKRLKEKSQSLLEIKKMFIMDRALLDSIKNIDNLKKINPQEAERLEEYIRKARNSPTDEEARKHIEKLKEYLSSKEEKIKEGSQDFEEKEIWEIYILPSRLVIPLGSSASLKTVAIYNKMFIKEIDSELEWFSSDPNIASVDEEGIVRSLSKGNIKINAKYKGISSQEVEVTVLDRIPEAIDKAIKGEL